MLIVLQQLHLYFFTLLPLVFCIEIDNGLTEIPHVQCNSDSIELQYRTRNSFEGHVYVKGFFNDIRCKSGATQRTSTSITVSFDAGCGIRRQRTVTPTGISASVTVIISFHPRFLTKVDRAYNVRCFYMEAEKTVEQQLSVSMLSTTDTLAVALTMPVCRYEVLRNNINGQQIQYAVIGEPVYHLWRCESTVPQSGLFCMTVHSCTVDDGSGNAVRLLDSNGCSQDKYLLNNLEYLNDLSAGQEAHVFKYADKPTVFFSCQIRLTLRAGFECQEITNIFERSADSCPTPGRGRRDIGLQKIVANLDVVSGDVTVLDLNEKAKLADPTALIRGPSIEELTPTRVQSIAVKETGICVTKAILAISLAAVIFLMVLFGVAMVLLFRKLRKFDLSSL